MSRMDALESATGEEQPLSVSEITAQIKQVVEGTFPSVWVTGEISDFARPKSGHCYFTLKDDKAQIRAVIWRGAAARLQFDPHDGLEVVCQGGLDVYAARGSYQLSVRQMQPKGIGSLELAFRQLREKLQAEGLFDPDLKRPLPVVPQHVAFVTSPTGAAVHDFLQVVQRRWPTARITVVPVRVQGQGAADEISRAIRGVNKMKSDVDVLVVGRGGGSLEDLWSFNEESVVRAIAESRIIVVSAVGHEIDVTLSDLAADVRALTPSEAAERVFPDMAQLTHFLRSTEDRLANSMRGLAVRYQAQLRGLAARPCLASPYSLIQQRAQRLDELQTAALRSARRQIERKTQRVATFAAQLEALSPLAVLGRGYSVTQTRDGRLVQSADQLEVDDVLETRLAKGRVVSRVEALEN